MSDLPDDAAYGRVTRPERFAPLQEFAQRLVDDLVNEFDAEFHREDPTNTRNLRAGEGALTRVCARPGDGGCVAVRETPFPGVVLEVGRWHSFHFPRCGCDACDEQLDDLTVDMADIVEAFVNGRFTEYLDGGRLGYSWSTGARSASGWSELDATDPRRDQIGETITWSPWPRRLSPPGP